MKTYNTELYPPDYPTSVTSVAGDPTSPGDNAEIVDSITALAVQARDAARRHAYSRQIILGTSIQDQNRLVDGQIYPLPFAEVAGIKNTTPFVYGTVAYFAAGRTYDSQLVQDANALYFGNESVAAVGLRLSQNRNYVATLSEGTFGVYAGGTTYSASTGWTFAYLDIVDELSFDKPSLSRLGQALLSDGGRFGAVGVGNKIKGVFLGGSTGIVGPTLALADLMTYSTRIISSQGDKLNHARMASHGGTQTQTDGYIWSGSATSWFPIELLQTIEACSFDSLDCTVLGVQIASHNIHAAFGYPEKGFVAGGQINTAGLITDQITGFNYQTAIAAVLGAKLAEPRICADGAGTSQAGYAVGGDSINFDGRSTIDKLLYPLESTYRLGTALPTSSCDRGSVSDYGSGLY